MDATGIVPRIHIVGRKNAGKTTLVCELVGELSRRGLRVATVKHTHHNHELDTPGKDSHRHRISGAVAVGVLSAEMTGVFIPQRRETDEQTRYAVFRKLFQDVDLIVVEGDLSTTALKLEVWRSELRSDPYAASDESIGVVISDDDPAVSCEVWPRDGLSKIADHLLQRLKLPVSG